MFSFLFSDAEPEAEPFKETMLITAWNEVGERILMEVPTPVRSDVHPRLRLPVGRNLTFLRYDTERGQT
jgi:hypothetical protein